MRIRYTKDTIKLVMDIIEHENFNELRVDLKGVWIAMSGDNKQLNAFKNIWQIINSTRY